MTIKVNSLAVSAMAFCLSAGRAFCADPIADADYIKWNTAVTNGSYAEAANWTGEMTPMDAGKYGYISFQAQDMTITAPSDGLVENFGTVFLGTGSGTHTLTLDTRGTYWEKRGVTAVHNWWGAPFAQNASGTHIFNFEGLSTVANNNLLWRFDDALFTWTSTATTRQDFELHEGTFTIGANPYVGSTGSTVNFNVRPEACLDCRGVFYQRGNASTHTVFWGGNHRLGGLVLKDADSGSGCTWIVLTNDAAVSVTRSLKMGDKGRKSDIMRTTGVLDLYGTSHMTVAGSSYLGTAENDAYANIRNMGVLTLHDNAVFTASNIVYIGYAQCSTGIVTVTGSSVLEAIGSNIQLAYGSNSVGRLTVQDDAQLHCAGVLRPGVGGKNSNASIVFKDRARGDVGLVTGNWLTLASGTDGVTSRVDVADNAVLTLGNAASIEMTLGGTSHATLALSGNGQVLGGNYTFVTNKSAYAGNTCVTLADNAVLAVRYVAGGVPGTDGEPAMTLAANGGTLRLCGAGAPARPFISGCQATLGANGLTLDAAHSIVLSQAFTAADGADAATITKTGVGRLTVRKNSSHPRTVVNGGTLVFGTGVTTFGRKLEFAAGTRLALEAASVRVEADELAFADTLMVDVPSDCTLDATNTFLSLTTPLTAAQAAKVMVGNPETGKAYELVPSADGKTLALAVHTVTAATLAWKGTAGGAWSSAANWEPAQTPTHNDTVTFAADATPVLDGLAAAYGFALSGTPSVTVSGTDPFTVLAGATVPAGASLTLAAPVCNTASFTKDGAGTLILSGDNAATMAGDWRMTGGVTAFTAAGALGMGSDSENALAISNCTFRYTGDAATVTRPWKTLGEYPCVFDIANDLTFANFKLVRAQGDNGLVKTGAGTLTLQMPSGTTTLSGQSKAERKGNADPSGMFAPVNGEVSNWNGAGQLTILDGRLALVGEGKTSTYVNQEHHGLLGGAGWATAQTPELYLKDLTFTQGSGNGFHFLMDQEVKKGSPAARLVLDNADMTCNALYLGYSRADGNEATVRTSLAITNGTLSVNWYAVLCTANGFSPVIRVGTGGVLQRVSGTAAGGVTFGHGLDAEFADGGLLKVGEPQSLWLDGTISATVAFRNGGGMVVTGLEGLNNSGRARFVFDGGYAAFTRDGSASTVNYPSGDFFEATANGGELRVDAGVTHAFAIPLRGAGAFTKTGAGTLAITNAVRAYNSSSKPAFASSAYAPVIVCATGGLVVAEGTVRCAAGTTDAASRFSGTGTLSGTFGTFGLFAAVGTTDALTLADLTAERVIVDFGHALTEPVARGTAVVAKFASAADFAKVAAWRVRGCGTGRTATLAFNAANGLLTATVRNSGCAIYLK